MFRFTIRDLLWLTIVVALAILWQGEFRQRSLDSADLRANMARLAKERDDAISRWQNSALYSRPMLMPGERKSGSESLLSEIAKLRAKVELQQRLIDLYAKQRKDIKDAASREGEL